VDEPQARVTVVLPTYNRSWGLRRAIASVLGQTYRALEVVVMDDASTDDTEAVARSFADARVRYHRQPANVGIGRNWGDGLRRAATPYVCFLMDDDFQSATFLENRVRLLERYPDALVAFSGYRRVGEDGAFLQDTAPPGCEDGRVYEAADLLDIFLARGGVFVGAMLYRREAIAELWDEIERYDLVVDLALNMKLALRPGARGVYCGAFDFNLCSHGGQTVHAASDRVYVRTEQVLLDQLAQSKGAQARFFRRNYANFLTGWAFAAADRDRRLALTRLLKSIALAPFSGGVLRRRLYILALILGLRKKPAVA
jgi:glycosyltransferase involved in cell wall biosynthesis